MSELTDREKQIAENKNKSSADSLENTSLQNRRAAILEKHLKINNEEPAANNNFSSNAPVNSIETEKELEKELELLNLKSELYNLKSAQLNKNTESHDKEFTKVLDKLLPDFLHEISSPVSSVEYSSDNLQVEYQKLITSFIAIADADGPAEGFQKVIGYVSSLETNSLASFDAKELREKKKKFVSDLTHYQIKNPQRAAEFLMSSGVYGINEKLHWIIKQPQGHLLFDMLISLLSIKQSFAVLDAAKSRSRYLVSTLKNYTNKLPDTTSEIFDLKTSIETAIVLVKQRLKSCNFSFQYDADCFIDGNIQHIVHVWINLLSNAVEATNGTGTIAVNVFKDNKDVVVTIQDNGPGIPAEIISKIFTPYFTTKKNQGGTGIGLDICKNVIFSIGGIISVSSQPGKTIFTVRILKYAASNK
jgi:hypothetical protein